MQDQTVTESTEADAFFRRLGEEEDRLRGRFYAIAALVGLPLLLWRHFLSGDPEAFWFGPVFFMMFFFILPKVIFHTAIRQWLARRQARLCRENGYSNEDLQQALAPRRDAFGLADEKKVPPSKALMFTLVAVALLFFLLLLASTLGIFRN